MRWLAICAVAIAAVGCGVQGPATEALFQSTSIQVVGVDGGEAGPLEGQTLSGSVTVSLSAPGWVGETSFFLDSEPGAGEPLHVDAEYPFEFVLDTTALADGVHTLAVEAVHVNSKAGKSAVEIIEFTVDNGGDGGQPSDGGDASDPTDPVDGAEPPSATNQAPSVDAGADQAIVLGSGAQLSGSTSDDGLPNGELSLTWSAVSGPGSVRFADPTQANTSAEFSEAGVYRLRLSASDGELSASDSVDITVEAASQLDPATILWRHGFESGSIAPFKEWNSGDATSRIVSDITRSGDYAAAGTITAPSSSGSNSGVRLAVPFLEDGSKLPRTAYYSSWFYIPEHFTGSSIIYQYKQHDPSEGNSDVTFTISARNRRDGSGIYLAATTHVGTDGVHKGQNAPRKIADAAIDVPVGRWFHVECRYVWDESDGAFTCWQDGTRLWDFQGIQTDYGYGAPTNGVNKHRQWIIGNYSRDIDPSPMTIVMDDVIIATQRTGN